MNGERAEADSFRHSLVINFVEGYVKDGSGALAKVVVSDVGSDANDCVDGFIRPPGKGATEGILAGQESFDEGLINDGRSRRSVFRAKVATRSKWDTHRR